MGFALINNVYYKERKGYIVSVLFSNFAYNKITVEDTISNEQFKKIKEVKKCNYEMEDIFRKPIKKFL